MPYELQFIAVFIRNIFTILLFNSLIVNHILDLFAILDILSCNKYITLKEEEDCVPYSTLETSKSFIKYYRTIKKSVIKTISKIKRNKQL